MSCFQSARSLAIHVAVGLSLLTLAHLFFERLPSVRGDAGAVFGAAKARPMPDARPWTYGDPPAANDATIDEGHPYDRF